MQPINPFLIDSSLVGRFGGLTFPLNPADFNGSLVPLDPVRSRLVQLFASAIRYELGPVWSKLTGQANQLTGKRPIESILELDPSAHDMREAGVVYPVLALHRVGDQEWSDHTMQIEKCEQDWNLHYILPALDIATVRRVSDVFRIIPEIVRRVIRARGHISFENGALQFFPDKGGIGYIKMTNAKSGQAQFGGQVQDPLWWATTITLHTIEYGYDDENEFAPFNGVDWSIGVGDSTGIIPNLLNASTDD